MSNQICNLNKPYVLVGKSNLVLYFNVYIVLRPFKGQYFTQTFTIFSVVFSPKQ